MSVIRTGPFAGFPLHDYDLVMGDPAWRFITHDETTVATARSKKVHYRTMTLDAIKALPVADLAAPNCVLILWSKYPPAEPGALNMGPLEAAVGVADAAPVVRAA
jgi:hypothetical protein